MKIDKNDIVKIEFLLAKIMMVGSYATISEFKSFYESVTNNYSRETGILHFNSPDRQVIFRFIVCCREELGLSDQKIEEHILQDIVLQGELLYNLEKVENLDADTLETLKDIYGFLVFSLGLNYRNIEFSKDGFKAFISRVHKPENCFFICGVENQNIILHVDGGVEFKGLDMFEFRMSDNIKDLLIKPSDRKDFQLYFTKMQKTIAASYVKKGGRKPFILKNY